MQAILLGSTQSASAVTPCLEDSGFQFHCISVAQQYAVGSATANLLDLLGSWLCGA